MLQNYEICRQVVLEKSASIWCFKDMRFVGDPPRGTNRQTDTHTEKSKTRTPQTQHAQELNTPLGTPLAIFWMWFQCTVWALSMWNDNDFSTTVASASCAQRARLCVSLRKRYLSDWHRSHLDAVRDWHLLLDTQALGKESSDQRHDKTVDRWWQRLTSIHGGVKVSTEEA